MNDEHEHGQREYHQMDDVHEQVRRHIIIVQIILHDDDDDEQIYIQYQHHDRIEQVQKQCEQRLRIIYEMKVQYDQHDGHGIMYHRHL
jgi:hypothetical protein